VGALLRSYASIANELAAAGYRIDEIEQIKDEVDHFAKVSATVKRNSGDYIDLKAFEPAMRHLIDTYIRAEESKTISDFDDLSLIALIVERGPEAVDALPKGLRKSEGAVAETIENNVRRIIVNETPVDPAYYETMSKLLDALIEQRRKGMLTYKDYLEKIAKLTRDATLPGGDPGGYPPSVKTAARARARGRAAGARGRGGATGRDRQAGMDQAAAGQVRRATPPIPARDGERRESLVPGAALSSAGLRTSGSAQGGGARPGRP